MSLYVPSHGFMMQPPQPPRVATMHQKRGQVRGRAVGRVIRDCVQASTGKQLFQPSNASAFCSNFAENLSRLDPVAQKQRLGEELYKMIYMQHPSLAGKITGMLLEMDTAELINLIESKDALAGKIEEALEVLRQHQIIPSM